jgi:hypothetical protein
MPLENVLFLALVVGALILFAAVLAYADWATSRVMRASAAAKLPAMNAAKKQSAQPATANLDEKNMSQHIQSAEVDCTECKGIVTRTYRELRDTGYDDRDAFLSAARVLELRHPGHDRYYYFLRIGQWLGDECESHPGG